VTAARETGTAARPDPAADAAELARRTGVAVRRDEPLAPHTTMRVGGPADLLAVAGTVAELAALVTAARSLGIPFAILGRGSNLVVADRGIRGLTILCRAEGHRFDGERLIAEAGLPLARAATLAQRAGLSGLEFGLAIPGTVGGAVWANAGAHGSDVAAVLESVRLLNSDSHEVEVAAAELGLTYRDSRLKHQTPAKAPAAGGPAPAAETSAATLAVAAGDLVLAATFRLASADPEVLKSRLDEIRVWRREHQPLELPSAGSFFRNPPGDSAGRLIDAAGLKGLRVGGASVSTRHANFVVNDRSATAAEIRLLGERVRAEVSTRFGVDLVYEVQFIGDWGEPETEEQ
jgi:UDP-N-acetylmuramate dehydrogenase